MKVAPGLRCENRRRPPVWLAPVLLLAVGVGLSPARAAGGGGDDALAANVRPLLVRYCVKCHGAEGPEGEVDLSALVDDAALEKHSEAAADAVAQLRGYLMPPPDRKKQPTEAEREQLVRELTAALDRLDQRRPPFAGPASVRRLNRAEYRNAVRDLLGMDVELSAEFPADDAAYGFDNLAEGLSLSPLLFEKYLAAAEEVLGKLAVPGPLDPQARCLELDLPGVRLGGADKKGKEPAAGEAGEAKEAVVLAPEKEVAAAIEVPKADDYEVRVRAGREGPGADPTALVVKARRHRRQAY